MLIQKIIFIFWGVLFLVVDIFVGGFDLFSDIIGFVLLYFGFRGMIPYDFELQTRNYRAAEYVSVGIVISSIQQVFRLIISSADSLKDDKVLVIGVDTIFVVLSMLCFLLPIRILERNLSVMLVEAGREGMIKYCQTMTGLFLLAGGLGGIAGKLSFLGRFGAAARVIMGVSAVCYLLMLRKVKMELEEVYL